MRHRLRARHGQGAASSRLTAPRPRARSPAPCSPPNSSRCTKSLRFTTAARATVFLYAAPFLVALGAAFLIKDERLRPIQWVGLAFAFLGVVCGFVGRTKGGSLAGDALAFLAAALWAATTIVIKATPLRRIDPMKDPSLSDRSSLRSSHRLPPLRSAKRRRRIFSATSVGVLLWQGVVVAGVSYALWFWTLTRYAVAQLSAFTFITPLVGVLRRLARVRRDPELGVFAWRSFWSSPGLALVNWPRRRATLRKPDGLLAARASRRRTPAPRRSRPYASRRAGPAVGQTGTVASPAGVHSARKS